MSNAELVRKYTEYTNVLAKIKANNEAIDEHIFSYMETNGFDENDTDQVDAMFEDIEFTALLDQYNTGELHELRMKLEDEIMEDFFGQMPQTPEVTIVKAACLGLDGVLKKATVRQKIMGMAIDRIKKVS